MKTAFTETKVWEILKSSIIAVVVTLVAILVSAFLIKITGLPDSSIAIFDIFIKILSLLIGCFFGFRGGDKGWLKGIITGAVFVVLSFIVFGILTGQYNFNVKFLYNMLLGLVAGMVAGMGVSVVKH